MWLWTNFTYALFVVPNRSFLIESQYFFRLCAMLSSLVDPIFGSGWISSIIRPLMSCVIVSFAMKYFSLKIKKKNYKLDQQIIYTYLKGSRSWLLKRPRVGLKEGHMLAFTFFFCFSFFINRHFFLYFYSLCFSIPIAFFSHYCL